MIQNGAPGRPRACLSDLGSAPLDPPRNQICPKRSPDTKIAPKSDQKTPKSHQKSGPQIEKIVKKSIQFQAKFQSQFQFQCLGGTLKN